MKIKEAHGFLISEYIKWMQEKLVTEISIMMINLETALEAAGLSSLAPWHLCYASGSSSLCP